MVSGHNNVEFFYMQNYVDSLTVAEYDYHNSRHSPINFIKMTNTKILIKIGNHLLVYSLIIFKNEFND